MTIVRVAVDVPVSTLFDYVLPASMHAVPGQRVLVSFARKKVIGIVMECSVDSGIDISRLKQVDRAFDEIPPLSPDLLKLLLFCSEYYRYPVGAAVLSALPARLRSCEPVSLKVSSLFTLSVSGHSLNLDLFPKRKLVQRRILMALKEGPLDAAQLREISPSVLTALKSLLESGWVETCTARQSHSHAFHESHVLSVEQQQVVQAVKHSQGYHSYLLHGITGSGKTEVYVHLMHEMLQRGGQVLLLVPEINLTPQLEHYFRRRFPDTEFVSLHSGLAEGLRTQNWLLAQNGAARIVLGTRLAVFTQMPHLALIIVDEEHDSSFKQQDGLRYSARDVAVFRASQMKIPIVLGSATPSLESYFNAQSGRYRILKLTERATTQAQLPDIRCININHTTLHHGISDQLLRAIELRISRGEQSLVFINRRGYAPVLMCTSCGWLSSCPHCAGKLVLHLKDKRLRCHHCAHQQKVPAACPNCGNADLLPVGSGTQRVEDVLQQHFPEARILRVDRDSTRSKGAWAKMRMQIHEGKADILIGTQMLAKGHDFPGLTLVGVINPDSALYSSDFRASERLFAQLAQVAGRAGRASKPGEVLIQTGFPDHPLFHALRNHDYDTWAQTLLAERRVAGFPPYSCQALLRAEGRQQHEVHTFLHRARDAALTLGSQTEVYGVVPAALPKRANHFLAQLLVQHESRKLLQNFLYEWMPLVDTIPAKGLRWSLDVDPLDY